MALTHRPADVTFQWPDPATLDAADMLLGYDTVADILTVAFRGVLRAIVDPLDWTRADYVALRLDPDTDEVVGIHLEAVHIRALREHPAWRVVVDATSTEPGMRQVDAAVWPALPAFVADVRALAQS